MKNQTKIYPCSRERANSYSDGYRPSKAWSGLMVVFLSFLSLISFPTYAQTITTIAGTGTAGFSGDGGLATLAKINYVLNTATDDSGSVYLADLLNHRIRKINPSGIISTIAGNGTLGYEGDGGPSTDAELVNPMNIVADHSGNIYFTCNCFHSYIRKINQADGTISLYAGDTSITGYSGDGGPASAALLMHPIGMAVDSAGNFYFADNNDIDAVIRKINYADGIIHTIAGIGTVGYTGDGGPATLAKINPGALAIDNAGNIYFSDYTNKIVRKINNSGIISTIAGGGTSFADGVPATTEMFVEITSVATDNSGNIYIADDMRSLIFKVNPDGLIYKYAGGGSTLGDGGPATDAELTDPSGVTTDHAGNIYIADPDAYRVRKVSTPLSLPKAAGSPNTISLYPNPATNELIITGAQNCEIRIYNPLGTTELSIINTDTKRSIDLSILQSGIYTIEIIDQDTRTRVVRRLVKG